MNCNKMIPLPSYFTLEEMTRSSTAEANDIRNIPDSEQTKNILNLIRYLNGIRHVYGSPVTVTSGFRSPKLNRMVGGSRTSQHMSGTAADIKGRDMKGLFELIREHGGFDQLIWEFGSDERPDWIHVSVRTDGNRGQVLKSMKKDGNTIYKRM